MPPTIAHIIGQLTPGGAERQLVNVAEALRERGWRQSVVTFRAGGYWEPRLVDRGIPVLHVDPNPNKLRRLWQLRSRIREIRPDVIHSWSDHTNFYLRWLPAFPAGRKVLSLRGDPGTDRVTGARLARPRHLSIYDRAGCVVSNSALALESLRSHGARLARTAIVGNIVADRPRARPGELTANPRLFAAGRLIPLKAYDVLLRALAALLGEGYDFELRIAGDGEERTRLESLATELGLSDRLKILGTVDTVPREMERAHLLVHPSLSEGLSNTVLEGMAAGLPVVASRVGAIPEVVEHGKSGYLVAPGSVDELVPPLRSLLSDQELRASMGEAGLAFVRENCSAETVARQYERVYEQLLASGATPVNTQSGRKAGEQA